MLFLISTKKLISSILLLIIFLLTMNSKNIEDYFVFGQKTIKDSF